MWDISTAPQEFLETFTLCTLSKKQTTIYHTKYLFPNWISFILFKPHERIWPADLPTQVRPLFTQFISQQLFPLLFTVIILFSKDFMCILSTPNVIFPMKVLFVTKQKNHTAHIFSLKFSVFLRITKNNNETKTGSQFVFEEYWVGIRN